MPSSVLAAAPAGDYADYYKRIKEMAKDRGMKEPDVQVLLKDRAKGEQEHKQVSAAKAFRNSFRAFRSEFHILNECSGIYLLLNFWILRLLIYI